uniref:Uncharacterized protein n=1 Tax=Oryza rufipogon TaxID=4529 RepID=A0A0E0NF73_ORYRU
MSPLRRVASPRHRRHVFLPMDRRPLLHSTAVTIDLAAVAALPSPSSPAPFSVDIDLAAVAVHPSSSTAAPFSTMPVPLVSTCIRRSRSVCKMVACAKGIRMPAKGLSVFRCDVEVDARR